MSPGELIARILEVSGGSTAPAWMLLGALAVATLASEDLACIAAGMLVASGRVEFVPAAFACCCGIFIGDVALMGVGRWPGRILLGYWPLRKRVTPEALVQAEAWFAARGAGILFASRFLPGTRLPTYLAAGILRLPWRIALPWFTLAVLLWTPALVAAGWGFGEVIADHLESWSRLVPVLLVGGAIGWALLLGLRTLTSFRGRRQLLGRWRRLTRWEYWPAWAVYPPILAQVIWLGLRHRGLTVCTAANPGIECGGGLVGESKSGILRGLAKAGDRVAPWTLIKPGDPEERLGQVNAFQSRGPFPPFPLVLKPDIGERGSGVVIARSPAEIREKLGQDPNPLIAQAYVPGVEFGVFYYRHPETATGSILAITEKHTTQVLGDGRSTLETLILADARAVAMAPYFLKAHASHLHSIPKDGERFLLAELGTHCRGALFLDGARLETPELREAIDAVSKCFEGFHFGRYDVRSPSAEAFQKGEFTVIELNGLSSEATSIYDPRHSVLHGWKVLLRQWRIAYAIGAANRRAGARVPSLREVLALLRKR